MHTTRFGRTGLQVSRLGFGAAPIGFLETGDDRVARIVGHLLDAGVNLLDTAAMYLGSEEMLARAIGPRRDDVVLVSKCGHEVDDSDAPAWSPRVVTETVDRALRRLATDRLDVMLLHSCSLDVLRAGDALGALVAAREAGKVRFVGYSGDDEAAAWAAAQPDVAVVETSVNLCDQSALTTVLPACAQHDVGVLAKRPIANAAWRARDARPGIYKDYGAEYERRFVAMGLDRDALGVGDASWGEIALRFTLSDARVHTAIVGTTNPEHVRANVEAVARGPLPDSARAAIRAAFARAERTDGARWPGLT